MKPIKIISFSCLTLFLIGLVFIAYAASTTISSEMDRPQWEENLTEWDYFYSWSILLGISLLLIWGLLCAIFGIIKVIDSRFGKQYTAS